VATVLVGAVASSSLLEGGLASATNSRLDPVTASMSMRVQLDGNGLGLAKFGAPAALATEAITAVLGAPTGHPSAGCTGKYAQVAWHDLIVQFTDDRFTGYRYVAGGSKGVSPSVATLHEAVVPMIATATRITLGSTVAEVRRAYRSLHRSGTDFWRTPSGIVFAFYSSQANPSSLSPVYEIKDNVCPPSL
jgi:hypothetical protein